MTAAIFTLIGTVLGVLGTVVAQLISGRTEDIYTRRKELRDASADFAAAIARVRELGFQMLRLDADVKDSTVIEQAHLEARSQYERLRLTASSIAVQEAGRRTLRYAFGVVLQATGKPLRADEQERGPAALVNDSLIELYAAVRRELGLPRPDEIYREPDEWLRIYGLAEIGPQINSQPPLSEHPTVNPGPEDAEEHLS